MTNRRFNNNLRIVLLIVFGLLALQLCNSCDNVSITSSETTAHSKQDTLTERLCILVDKSLSINDRDSAVLQKIERQLDEALNAIDKPQSVVTVMFIYENSASLSNRHHFVFEPPVTSLEGLHGTELEVQQQSNAQRTQLYLPIFKEEVKDFCLKFKANAQATNIAELLPVLAEYCQAGEVVNTLFISDMIESGNFRQMNFYGNSMHTHEKCRKIAQQDAKRLKTAEYGMNDSSLACISSMKVTLPAVEMSKHPAMKLAPSYWSELLMQFGVQQVDYQ